MNDKEPALVTITDVDILAELKWSKYFFSSLREYCEHADGELFRLFPSYVFKATFNNPVLATKTISGPDYSEQEVELTGECVFNEMNLDLDLLDDAVLYLHYDRDPSDQDERIMARVTTSDLASLKIVKIPVDERTTVIEQPRAQATTKLAEFVMHLQSLEAQINRLLEVAQDDVSSDGEIILPPNQYFCATFSEPVYATYYDERWDPVTDDMVSHIAVNQLKICWPDADTPNDPILLVFTGQDETGRNQDVHVQVSLVKDLDIATLPNN